MTRSQVRVLDRAQRDDGLCDRFEVCGHVAKLVHAYVSEAYGATLESSNLSVPTDINLRTHLCFLHLDFSSFLRYVDMGN